MMFDPSYEAWVDPWEGYVKRHRELLEFLKGLDDHDIVINVDGFDTIVLCPLKNIIRKFKAMNCDLLFSMTADNGNLIQKYVQWKLGFYGEKANAGMFMGYAFKMREFIEKVLASGEYNDQIVVNRMLGSIKIDTNQEIFCNVVNTSGLHIHNGELCGTKTRNRVFYRHRGVSIFDRFFVRLEFKRRNSRVTRDRDSKSIISILLLR
jgi:hypothetical protein